MQFKIKNTRANLTKISLNIAGMNCVNCANNIEKIIKKIKGINDASVSYTNASGVFLVDDIKVKILITNKIKALGYDILDDNNDIINNKSKELKKLKIDLMLSVFISILTMIFMFYHILATMQFILGFVGVFYCGRSFHIHSFKGIINKNLDMNTLISLGSLSAFVYSCLVYFGIFKAHIYFAEASMIIAFVLFGKLLETKPKLKALIYNNDLLNNKNSISTIIIKNQTQEIPSDFIKAGDIILLKQGQMLSTDGVLLDNIAEFDLSAINGEFIATKKQTGDEIKAGSILISGVAYIKASINAIDSSLKTLQNAINQDIKLPISKITDKISAYFVGFIIVLACLVFIIWTILDSVGVGLLYLSNVLLISCPCAIGLAMPLALNLAFKNALKNHIFIKNPLALELLKKTNIMIFDKTGTLSDNKLSIYKHNLTKDDFDILKNIQNLSSHPIARAFDKNHNILKGDFKELISLGISYRENDDFYLAGNEALMHQNSIKISQNQKDFINLYSSKAPIIVYFAKNQNLLGVVLLNNEIKKEAFELIDFLKIKKIKSLILSGDNTKSASLCAKALNIDDFKADLSADDKANIIKTYKKDQICTFVGDGINDVWALKEAHISIAMGEGMDMAKGSGDLVLFKNDLSLIIYAYKLSSKCFRIIRQNLFWAFFYNILCIPIAAGAIKGIVLSPHIAAFAMGFSSLVVVFNSLRLRRL